MSSRHITLTLSPNPKLFELSGSFVRLKAQPSSCQCVPPDDAGFITDDGRVSHVPVCLMAGKIVETGLLMAGEN